MLDSKLGQSEEQNQIGSNNQNVRQIITQFIEVNIFT